MLCNLIDNGKSKWIVLLHCVCGNEKVFKHQMNMLNKYYNIAVIRLAGHDIKSTISEATFDYVVEEIRKFVVEKNCKIDIIGISMGAMIAAKYIIEHQDDVENAYLIGNIYGFSVPLLKWGYMALIKINKILPRALYMNAITKLILPYKHQQYQRKRLYATSRRISKEFLYAWMNEMGKFIMHGKKYLALVSNSSVNVRHIYGEKDIMFLGWLKKRYDLCQDMSLYIIDGVGHLCNMENPKEVNVLIEGDNHENNSNH